MPTTKTEVLFARVKRELAATVKASAEAEDVTISDWLRDAIEAKLAGDGEIAALRAEVAELREAVAGFTEFFKGRGPRLPMPDSVPPDWEGQPDYQHKHD